MIFSMIHSVDGGVGRIGRLFEGFGLFDRFGSAATQKAKSKMKKLLVLAAVSAMAMGAQAEYTYTLELPGAQAVYTLTLPIPFPLPKEATVATYWQNDTQPALFDESTAKQAFGGETWADNYRLFVHDCGYSFAA